MQKEQERIPSSNHEASRHCPLCKKTFAQESSRRRHYYYCRSKLPDTNTSRRRSCAACVRAKVRCIVPDEASSEACVRCRERSAECEFAVAARRKGESRGGSAQSAAHSTGKKSERHGSTTSLALARGSRRSTNLKTSVFPQTSANSAASLGWSTEDTWDAGLGDVDMFGLDTPLFGDQSINSLLYPSSEEPSMIETGISTLTPWDLSGPSLFEHRTFPRPHQGPLISLAMQILRSYPLMMLQKAALPPFISPLQSSWAETGVGPPQHSLLTCMGLVQLFKSRTDSSRNLVWKLIKLEQEKIFFKHAEFDKWELLAAFQALLVYCLLRLQEVPVGNDGFEAALLTTVNLVFNALVLSTGGIRKMKLPDDPGVTWMDWIYNESRRRTVLIFQILNVLIEMSTEASSYLTCGFVLMPLANHATLWNANHIKEWRTEYELCNKERKLHGLSQTGVLTKLQLADDCVVLSSVEWEEWRAEVGEIGTLVMIVGALL
ncbi:hypothetical protein B0T10DRAFT_541900 [Thelonectria olida]|uniref:Zn(2)-C6 fungal-type domain-containing protein n=1 Tax=Thelonectria olida TaxID=1576542 RepID=A0A9P8VP84_9HYPO|nr:hypothetical protein B0T10DRAFT_541900 [Thelonectria olida]